MIIPVISYFRLFLVLGGAVDAVVFGHFLGPLAALIVIGILELIWIVSERDQWRKRAEDEYRDRTHSWD